MTQKPKRIQVKMRTLARKKPRRMVKSQSDTSTKFQMNQKISTIKKLKTKSIWLFKKLQSLRSLQNTKFRKVPSKPRTKNFLILASPKKILNRKKKLLKLLKNLIDSNISKITSDPKNSRLSLTSSFCSLLIQFC